MPTRKLKPIACDVDICGISLNTGIKNPDQYVLIITPRKTN
jgi:hypothetical protein